jgi:hypothetical protein
VLDRGKVREVTFTPLIIGDHFAITTKDGISSTSIQNKLRTYSDAVAGRNDLAAVDEATYDGIAAKAYLRYRLECYWYFVTHFWKYEPGILFSSLFRSVLRRVGLA